MLSIKIRPRQYVGGHHQVAEVLYYLINIHCQQKNYRKAEEEAQRALELNQHSFSSEHPRTLTAMGQLIKVLIHSGQSKRAALILHNAKEKFEKIRDNKEYMSLEAMSMLGECLTLLKRFEEAEHYLNKSHQGFLGIRGEYSPDMVEVRQRLVNLYEAWGKKGLAAQFRTSFGNQTASLSR